MVVDTGAAISGLSESAARSLGLRDQGKAQLTGNGESQLPIAVAKDVVFRVGSAELREKMIAVLSFAELESHEGREVAGVLGVNLFQRYVVVIDYPGKTLALYEPQGFSYRGAGEIVPLRFRDGAMFQGTIEAEGREPMPCNLAVDSGTYSSLRLYRPFVQKHRLHEAGTPGIDSFGFGLGGEFPERLGRVHALKIGSLALQEPTVSFSNATSGATSKGNFDGTIGGDILSRFKVIFDYPHHQMVFEPAAGFSEPFPADTVGMIVGTGSPDPRTITVQHVIEGTPASEAGIKAGDVIDSVNGQNASRLGVEALRNLFRKPGSYRLELRRNGQALNLAINAVKPLY
jgi:hypothetical protein